MQSALTNLRLRQFRNFEELELHIPRAGVAIIGENGSGKTNVLESIYYLEIFRSFRGGADEQLVRFGADAFHIRGHIDIDGRSTEIAAGYEQRERLASRSRRLPEHTRVGRSRDPALGGRRHNLRFRAGHGYVASDARWRSPTTPRASPTTSCSPSPAAECR